MGWSTCRDEAEDAYLLRVGDETVHGDDAYWDGSELVILYGVELKELILLACETRPRSGG